MPLAPTPAAFASYNRISPLPIVGSIMGADLKFILILEVVLFHRDYI
jgi:hypothetical protein